MQPLSFGGFSMNRDIGNGFGRRSSLKRSSTIDDEDVSILDGAQPAQSQLPTHVCAAFV